MGYQYALRIDDPHRAWAWEGEATESEIFEVTGGVVTFEDHPDGGRRPYSSNWAGDERGTYGPMEPGLMIVVRINDGATTTMPAGVFAALWATYTPQA